MSKLTDKLIAEAALKIVDKEGLTALSMRRLGGELQADAKAIYYYFPSKDDLIATVLQIAFAEMSFPTGLKVSWQDQLKQIAYAYVKLVNAHPNLLNYFVQFDGSVPVVFEIVERIIGALVDTGLSARSIGQVVDLFSGFVPSFAVSANHIASRTEHIYQQISSLPEAQFPNTRRLLQMLNPADMEEDFELQMEIVLLGIEALIERERKSTQRSSAT